jgi:hypothetical protein
MTGQPPAQIRPSFDQRHLRAGLSQPPGGRHAGNAPAKDDRFHGAIIENLAKKPCISGRRILNFS